MQLDTNNIEFQRAFHLVTQTSRNIFLTGRAGTGKTTFLKYLKEHCQKSMAIVAPTGVAAINAGGVTIHSFFQIAPGFNAPNAPPAYKLSVPKQAVMRGLDLLVIDEISMVRCDLLEMIDKTLRMYGESKLPFGGKQILFIGDPYQLPSFVSSEEREVFFKFYHNVFFFKTDAFWNTHPVPIELKKIYRQNEKVFIELLNKIRVNEVTDEDIRLLNQKTVGINYPFAQEKYLCIGTKKDQVKSINEDELTKLSGKLSQIKGQITGKFEQNQLPTEEILRLKEGAQVMFVKNDSGGGNRYYNGKLAIIQKIQDDKIEVSFPEGGSTYVERATWEKIRYEWDEKEKKVIEKVDGTFTQFPLKLAWAITVHKSQGLSLERVFADVGESWDSGQVYVALSRCTTFDGLKLARPIPRSAIRVALEVQEFYQWVLNQTALQDQPPNIITLKADKTMLTGPSSVTIEWRVEGAKFVSLAGQANLPPEGKLTVRPRKERIFELVAQNDFGKTSKKTIEIQVKETPPVIYHFETDRNELIDRTPACLSWEVEGAEKIEIDGIGNVTGKSSVDFFTQKDCKLILKAESYFGTQVTKAINITVSKIPPIIELFGSDQQYVLKNMPIELFWQVNNAEKIEIAPLQFEQKASSGTHIVHIYESTIFQLTALSVFGFASRQTLSVHVIPVPVIESLWVPGFTIETKLNIAIERPTVPDFDYNNNTNQDFPLVKIETGNFTKLFMTNHINSSVRHFPDVRAIFEDIRLSVANQLQQLIEQFKK